MPDLNPQSDDDSDDEEQPIKVKPELGSAALHPFVRNVALGTAYHGAVSQSRHTPHSALLEIIENAKGRDAKGIHLQLSDQQDEEHDQRVLRYFP